MQEPYNSLSIKIKLLKLWQCMFLYLYSITVKCTSIRYSSKSARHTEVNGTYLCFAFVSTASVFLSVAMIVTMANERQGIKLIP